MDSKQRIKEYTDRLYEFSNLMNEMSCDDFLSTDEKIMMVGQVMLSVQIGLKSIAHDDGVSVKVELGVSECLVSHKYLSKIS